MTLASPARATRRDLIRVFGEDRLVAVVRVGSADVAALAARVLAEAGLRLIEITLTVPDAFELIERLSTDEDLAARGATVGAGTVLSGRQAEDALLAGARFLVSPILVPDMIRAARSRDAMSMPGTFTPTEIVQAAELGADAIKIFPIQSLGGPAYIANVRRAIPHLPLVPTGNIALDEIPAYEEAGAAGYGIGAPLIRPDLIEAGKREEAVANAKRFLETTRKR
ncbi:MAG: bifunctional 4-hydroxy-2-oxoglutarate aldolase/2-dehydro-3-deoxy-phosphogluconate aldolase [Candidatus Limnocylindria bacterium]